MSKENLTTSVPAKTKPARKKAVLGWRKGGLEKPSACPKVIWEEKYIADDRTWEHQEKTPRSAIRFLRAQGQ